MNIHFVESTVRKQSGILAYLPDGVCRKFSNFPWNYATTFLVRSELQSERRKILLMNTTQLPPEHAWSQNQDGKPYTKEGPAFSLSHSRSFSAIVVDTRRCEIGIDIEIHRPMLHWERIAERWYLPEEQKYCLLTGIEGFWKIWTEKEAMAKCVGGPIARLFPLINTLHRSVDGIKLELFYVVQRCENEELLHMAVARIDTRH